MSNIINIIWLEKNYDNEENISYLKQLEKNKNLKVKCFKEVDEGIKYIKTIKFKETIIIISGWFYSEFIIKFQNDLKFFDVTPKITIFIRNKDEFLNYNKDYLNYINHPYYNYGGIKTTFANIKNFILKQTNKQTLDVDYKQYLEKNEENTSLMELIKVEEGNFTFEYID